MLFSIENLLGISSKDKTAEERAAHAPCDTAVELRKCSAGEDKNGEELGTQVKCARRKRSSSDISTDGEAEGAKSEDEAGLESPRGEGESTQSLKL